MDQMDMAIQRQRTLHQCDWHFWKMLQCLSVSLRLFSKMSFHKAKGPRFSKLYTCEVFGVENCFYSAYMANNHTKWLCGSEMFRFFYDQHDNSIYCGNGSETFRFYVAHWPLEARRFASCTSTQQYSMVYIVGMEAKLLPIWLYGSEQFRFLLPIGYYKRNVSLSRTQYKNKWLASKITIY